MKEETVKKSGTLVLPCECRSPFQDTTYGRGQRVHNRSQKNPTANCTACGKKKTL